MSDKLFYQIIADELKTNNVDQAIWTQATESTNGNRDRTEAAYIRLRFLELIKSSNTQFNHTARNSLPRAQEFTKNSSAELAKLRGELAEKLATHGKHSLYSTLNLQPEVSDGEIASTILELESSKHRGVAASTAEFRYAKQTLGNPDLREKYDRKLLNSLSVGVTRNYPIYEGLDQGNTHSWWDSSKTSVIIGIVAVGLIGYLWLNYQKEKSRSQIVREAVVTVSDTEKMRLQAEMEYKSEALRLAAERQNHEMDLRGRYEDRVAEQQRMIQESRAQAEERSRQAAAQRQQTQEEYNENLRVMKEKRYWACMNSQMTVQLSQRGNSYDAAARCASYR